MELKVYHRTRYDYSSPARDSVNELKLNPKTTQTQVCHSCIVSVIPASSPKPYQDLYGNRSHHVEILEPHNHLVIEARMRVETAPSLKVEDYPYGVSMSSLPKLKAQERLHTVLQNSPYVEVNPTVWREAVDIMDQSSDVFQTAYAIMEFIFSEYDYIPGSTQVNTHSNEVVRKRTGVCQDFAHAMLAYCRALGIPARYVSGYFFDGTRQSGMLRGSEASHAWVEVYVKGFGWIGLDPTNNKVVDDTYIVLAVGRDYTDVAPVSGSYYGGGTSTLSVFVRVKKISEASTPSQALS